MPAPPPPSIHLSLADLPPGASDPSVHVRCDADGSHARCRIRWTALVDGTPREGTSEVDIAPADHYVFGPPPAYSRHLVFGQYHGPAPVLRLGPGIPPPTLEVPSSWRVVRADGPEGRSYALERPKQLPGPGGPVVGVVLTDPMADTGDISAAVHLGYELALDDYLLLAPNLETDFQSLWTSVELITGLPHMIPFIVAPTISGGPVARLAGPEPADAGIRLAFEWSLFAFHVGVCGDFMFGAGEAEGGAIGRIRIRVTL